MNGENGRDEVDVEVGTIDASHALEAVDRASIDIQIATAKAYPRDITKVLKEAKELATLDKETAESCLYTLRRGSKIIQGPSARLAEIMVYAFGNIRADADIVSEDRTHVTAMGTCLDLEKNIAVRVRVKRRITDSQNRRYNVDMIGVTSNAAISIALRNAVFKVIPAAMVRRIYDAARKTALGDAGSMTQKRQSALEWFATAGVEADKVFALLGVTGLDAIGVDELVTLGGLVNALKDGETTIEELFREESSSAAAADLDAAIRGTKDRAPEASKSQRKGLDELYEKAQADDVVDFELEALVESAKASGLEVDVLEATKELSSAIAKAMAKA